MTWKHLNLAAACFKKEKTAIYRTSKNIGFYFFSYCQLLQAKNLAQYISLNKEK